MLPSYTHNPTEHFDNASGTLPPPLLPNSTPVQALLPPHSYLNMDFSDLPNTSNSPNIRGARYAARAASTAEAQGAVPDIHTLLNDLELTAAHTQGVGTPGAEQGTTKQEAASKGTTTPHEPGDTAQEFATAARRRYASFKVHREELLAQLQRSSDLLLTPPPSPAPSTNHFSPAYATPARVATTAVQTQSFPPTSGPVAAPAATQCHRHAFSMRQPPLHSEHP